MKVLIFWCKAKKHVICSANFATMTMYLEWIGLMAGSCTTVAFLPQVVKTWKTKSAKDLSLGMFSIFTIGVTLWLLYGFMRNDLPIILANLLTLLFAATLLFFKLKWREK